jgi:RNA polymerase-binding transcription factor DksA/ribosome-associated translation inhibitor RaiA
MPDGLLQWYDDRRGEGRVVRGGREYPVRAADMESRARIPGARVHFDVKRHEGVPVAVGVRLREGTRVSRRQRRFGDMAGARRPDTRGSAPFARPHPDMGRRLASHPHAVVQRWAECVAANDLAGAVLLHAPEAVVHAGHQVLRGRRVRGWLSASGLPGHVRAVETAGAGDYVVLRWLGPGDRRATSWARVEHGELVELWTGGSRPPVEDVTGSAGHSAVEPAVEIVAREGQAEAAASYAERKVRRVMEVVDEPILHARVKLTVAPDPAVERPARVQATLDVNGQLVRAQVAAHTLHEAVDLLEQRLRARFERRADQERTLHRRGAAAELGEWRHGQVPADRPAWYDRPPDEREVVRRKTFALDELTLDEAVFDMEMLDLDFYLFRELATGGDAVLHRLTDGRFGLRRLDPSGIVAVGEAVEVDLEPGAAPELALEEALEWLNVAVEPFVFYRARETGRACVVYRRYDGHYGLITPADEPARPAEPSTARRRLRDELARLEAVRAALLVEALDRESETESVAEMSSIDQHQADLGTETFERERDLSLLEDVEREIADVQRALVRLDRGSYGFCEACGAQIPDERLSAVPAARFCLEHQAAAEVLGGLVT